MELWVFQRPRSKHANEATLKKVFDLSTDCTAAPCQSFAEKKKNQRCCAIRSWSLAIKFMRLIKGKTNQEHMVNENRLKHLTETSAAKHTYLRGSLEMLCFFSWRNFSSINYCCPVTRPWPHCGHSESGEEEGPEVTPTLDTTALRSLAENGMGFFFLLSFFLFLCVFLQGRINSSARPEWDQSAH